VTASLLQQLLDRGIWRKSYTIAGRRVIIAVDRCGDVAKRVQLRDSRL
jgi:hypothetical protein